MTDPRFVGICGDWHANEAYAEGMTFSLASRGIQAILHAGDFGYHFKSRYIRTLNSVLESYGIKLYFVDGNHEDFPKLYSFEIDENGLRPLASHLFHLPRGYRWKWNSLSFLACGGAVSVDKDWRTPHKEWWPDEEISYQDFDAVVEGGRADVMICHDSPAGVDIRGIKGNPHGFPERALQQSHNHRETLRSIVDIVKPQRLFHGHYHSRYDDVLVGNDYVTRITGLDMDRYPWYDNVVVLDTVTNEVLSGKELENWKAPKTDV